MTRGDVALIQSPSNYPLAGNKKRLYLQKPGGPELREKGVIESGQKNMF
jgi:hypothetical protein